MATRDWDKHYFELAAHISTWSRDDRGKVGAVIVLNNRIVATGFNGFPTNVLDDYRLEKKEIKQDMVVHAEVNALLVAGDRAKGATIYVYGKPVCSRCAASIIQSGIIRVVAIAPLPEKDENQEIEKKIKPGYVDWDKLGRLAVHMFGEAEICFHALKELDDTLNISLVDDKERDAANDPGTDSTEDRAAG